MSCLKEDVEFLVSTNNFEVVDSIFALKWDFKLKSGSDFQLIKRKHYPQM
jgi:hypothetical protein